MADVRPRAPKKTIREFEREVEELTGKTPEFGRSIPAFVRSLSSFLDGSTVTVHLYEEEDDEFVLRGTTQRLRVNDEAVRFGADGTLPGLAVTEHRIVSLAEDPAPAGRRRRAEEHVFPLEAGGRVLGAVTVAQVAVERLSPLRLDRARRGILRFAEALDTARTAEAAARRVNRLSAINEFGVILVSAHAPGEVPELATAMTSFIMGTEGCILRLRDEQGADAAVRDAHGLRDEASSREILKLEELASRDVLLSGQALLVRDVGAHERYRDWASRVRTFICLPLAGDGGRIGTITVFNKDPESPLTAARFGRDDRDVLLHLARYIEKAVANARLLSRSRELAERDEQTGLPDRAGFRARLLTEISRARRFRLRIGLVTCEVQLSPAEKPSGASLQRFAQAIRAAVREYDTVARIGERSFGVLLPQVQNGPGSPIARIRAAVLREADHQRASGGPAGLQVRLSHALFPDDGASGEEVLGRLERED